jgi:hypothetical protein
MIGLVAVLWALYLSESWVRWQRGDWVFRTRSGGSIEGVSEPDITFLDGRLGFVWTSLLPYQSVHVFTGSSLDRERCRIELMRLGGELVWLRAFSTGLFALVMLTFPLLVTTERLLPSLPLLLASFGVAWAGTLGAYFVAHRRVLGFRPPIESWLVLALSPVSLIRAPHVISMQVARFAHPVIAADALCGDEEFLRICRLWHFDAPDLRPLLYELAEGRGLLERLTAPPSSTEPEVSRYCERCHATFLAAATACADCEDVPLSPLPASASQDGAAAARAR